MKAKIHGEIPAGKYRILRLNYDEETDEIELYDKIERLAKVMNKTPEEMTKWIIAESARSGKPYLYFSFL